MVIIGCHWYHLYFTKNFDNIDVPIVLEIFRRHHFIDFKIYNHRYHTIWYYSVPQVVASKHKTLDSIKRNCQYQECTRNKRLVHQRSFRLQYYYIESFGNSSYNNNSRNGTDRSVRRRRRRKRKLSQRRFTNYKQHRQLSLKRGKQVPRIIIVNTILRQ